MSPVNETDTPQSLSSLQVGERGAVHSLNGGREFCSRVANMGFTLGALITVVQNFGRGPMIVSVRGTMVALGRAEAAKVLVMASESQRAARDAR